MTSIRNSIDSNSTINRQQEQEQAYQQDKNVDYQHNPGGDYYYNNNYFPPSEYFYEFEERYQSEIKLNKM